MANPYSTQTISNYNANPPEDDGSQVSTNEVEWDKHKTKLGDPIKTLAEAMNTELLSAFGKILFNNVIAKTSAYTIVEADQGKLFSVTNTTTITLPLSNVGANYAVAVYNAGSGIVTIDGNGAETINGSATIDLNLGGFAVLASNGSAWTALQGASEAYVDSFIGKYVNNANGNPNISDTSIDIDSAVTESTWESIGPTGGGKDNKWAVLDSLPSDIDWIEVKIVVVANSVADTANVTRAIAVYVRGNGSSAVAGHENIVVFKEVTTGGTGKADADTAVPSVKIPVSSKAFDIWWASSFNNLININLYLVGYGYNN